MNMQPEARGEFAWGEPDVEAIKAMAKRLRRDSLVATTAAGSGHPSSCFSAADIVSAIFFHFFRYQIEDPNNLRNDRFILSKGHAAPLLWAAWAEAGALPLEELAELRKLDSRLEGHPTPRFPWVEAATGSLGQGLSIGAGMALAARSDHVDNNIYVLLGDGEIAEGAVWEAAAFAGYYKLGALKAIVDVNGFGQSQATMYGHHLDECAARFLSCHWQVQTADGHDMHSIIDAFNKILANREQPGVILAQTVKGKGVSMLEDGFEHHGKPLKPGQMEIALAELGEIPPRPAGLRIAAPNEAPLKPPPPPDFSSIASPAYKPGDQAATREAYGTGLKKAGDVDERIVALDGDVKNSTKSEVFLKAHPQRFIESFIAEQNMIGCAVGLAALGKVPFVSTFAAFLTRAYDFIRMAGISQSNIKFCGSHAGVSIGEDGPSQMGLEDIAMMRCIPRSVVFQPSDAVSMERLVAVAAEEEGIVYLRSIREPLPVIYGNDETFRTGGSKILRSAENDQATVVATGICVHEALQAYESLKNDGIAIRVIDAYSIKPLDLAALRDAARDTMRIITVEDHYPEGGLGEAVAAALVNEGVRLEHLAVRGPVHSGLSKALIERHGISAGHIVDAVKRIIQARTPGSRVLH